MSRERLSLDTAFIQALLNSYDEYHQQANQLFPRVRSAAEVWLAEAILIEVGNALSRLNRNGAVQFIQQSYRTDNIRVVSVDTALLMQALNLSH
jgi:predicted nucleic-acid-binding protein